MNRPQALVLPLLAALLAPSAAPAQTADSTRIPLTIPGRTPVADTLAAGDRALHFYQRARAFEAAGKRAAALSAYRNCVLADPAFPDAYYRLGMLFIAFGDVEEARQCFDAELRNTPDHEQAGRELGLVLARLGRAEEGLPMLETYRDAHPDEGLAWYALGFAYMRVGRAEDAEMALERSIAIGPPNPVWHRDLGAVYAARGDLEGARREYATALRMDPQNPTPLVNLGNLELRGGRHEQALEAYRAAEAIDSTLHVALNGQVQVLRELGRRDEAAAVYRRWLSKRPGDHGARLEAVHFFQSIEQPGQAVAIAREGVATSDRSAEARMVLAIALEGAGHRDEAVHELERARELYRLPAERERAQQLIDRLRGDADPDSLAPGANTP